MLTGDSQAAANVAQEKVKQRTFNFSVQFCKMIITSSVSNDLFYNMY